MSTSPLAELHAELSDTSKFIEGRLDRLSKADAKAARQVLAAIEDVPNEADQQDAFLEVCGKLDLLMATYLRLAEQRSGSLPKEKFKRVDDEAKYFDSSRRPKSQE